MLLINPGTVETTITTHHMENAICFVQLMINLLGHRQAVWPCPRFLPTIKSRTWSHHLWSHPCCIPALFSPCLIGMQCFDLLVARFIGVLSSHHRHTRASAKITPVTSLGRFTRQAIPVSRPVSFGPCVPLLGAPVWWQNMLILVNEGMPGELCSDRRPFTERRCTLQHIYDAAIRARPVEHGGRLELLFDFGRELIGLDHYLPVVAVLDLAD